LCLAIKHSILQESLPTVVTTNIRKVTLALKFLRPVAQTNYYFQRNKGLIAHNPLTDQRV